VREIATKSVPDTNTGGMSQRVSVVKDSFLERGQWCGDENKELFRRIKNGGFNIKGRYNARQTTESATHYESWYA
jgi:hypothetical protein